MDEELVTVATTYDIVEAEYLRGQLEGEGFEVFLADENVVGVYNLLAGAVGGIKIRVPLGDAPDAAEIIGSLRNHAVEYVEGDDVSANGAAQMEIDTGWGACEMCRSLDLTPEREIIGWKWILVFFMIPAVRVKRKLVCNNCGFEWIEEKQSR